MATTTEEQRKTEEQKAAKAAADKASYTALAKFHEKEANVTSKKLMPATRTSGWQLVTSAVPA
jgi:hypothetical protein